MKPVHTFYNFLHCGVISAHLSLLFTGIYFLLVNSIMHNCTSFSEKSKKDKVFKEKCSLFSWSYNLFLHHSVGAIFIAKLVSCIACVVAQIVCNEKSFGLFLHCDVSKIRHSIKSKWYVIIISYDCCFRPPGTEYPLQHGLYGHAVVTRNTSQLIFVGGYHGTVSGSSAFVHSAFCWIVGALQHSRYSWNENDVLSNFQKVSGNIVTYILDCFLLYRGAFVHFSE